MTNTADISLQFEASAPTARPTGANVNDPLDFGAIHLQGKEIPKFTSGKKIIQKLQNLAIENKQVRIQFFH